AIVVFFLPSGSPFANVQGGVSPRMAGRARCRSGPRSSSLGWPGAWPRGSKPTRFPEEPQRLTSHATPSHPQVGFAEGLVGQELRARAGQHDAAALEDVAAAGEGERVPYVLLHEEDGGAARVDGAHDLEGALHVQRRQPDGRLV